MQAIDEALGYADLELNLVLGLPPDAHGEDALGADAEEEEALALALDGVDFTLLASLS